MALSSAVGLVLLMPPLRTPLDARTHAQASTTRRGQLAQGAWLGPTRSRVESVLATGLGFAYSRGAAAPTVFAMLR